MYINSAFSVLCLLGFGTVLIVVYAAAAVLIV